MANTTTQYEIFISIKTAPNRIGWQSLGFVESQKTANMLRFHSEQALRKKRANIKVKVVPVVQEQPAKKTTER